MTENNHYKRPESVLVVVYSTSGHVLMLRRAFPEGFWQSVTGSLEWGEQAMAAAKREVFEETGLDATTIVDCKYSQEFEIYSIWRDRYAPGITKNLEHVFVLPLPECVEINLDAREHCEFRWVSRNEALDLAISHTNVDAIERWVPKFD